LPAAGATQERFTPISFSEPERSTIRASSAKSTSFRPIRTRTLSTLHWILPKSAALSFTTAGKPFATCFARFKTPDSLARKLPAAERNRGSQSFSFHRHAKYAGVGAPSRQRSSLFRSLLQGATGHLPCFQSLAHSVAKHPGTTLRHRAICILFATLLFLR